jgi:hypothetical protein
MEFTLTIQIGARIYKMLVKQIYKSDQIERYEVTGGRKSIILRNNRPFLKNTGSRKKPEWKLEKGEYKDAKALAWTIEAIEQEIERIENPHGPYIHPKDLYK